MIATLLVLVILTILVFRPLRSNWGFYRQAGILRRQLAAFALLTAGICGTAMMFHIAYSWRLLAVTQGARAANHLLLSPLALVAEALLLAFLIQALFPSTLMPFYRMRRRTDSAADAIFRALKQPESVGKCAPMNPIPASAQAPAIPTEGTVSRQDLRFTFPVTLKSTPRGGQLIFKGPEVTSGCLHEAGHALLHLLRGDNLLSVWYRAEPHIDAQLRELVAGAGGTEWRTPDRDCACGGFVRNLRERLSHSDEQYNGAFDCILSLRPQCSECMQYAVTYLAAVYAGSAATECYMPNHYDPSGNLFDDRDVDRWFENLPWLAPYKTDLIHRGKTLASKVIRREQQSVTALSMFLAFNDVPVDGSVAERIIRENLVSESLVV